MDQKVQSKGSEAAGVVLIAVGVMILPVAIGLLFAFPDWIWSMGLLLLACSYFIIAGGWKNIKQAKIVLKKSQMSIEQMMNENGPVMEIDRSGRLLKKDPGAVPELIEKGLDWVLVWQYSPEEWKRFLKWEKQDRKLSAFVTGLLVALIGGVFVENFIRAGQADLEQHMRPSLDGFFIHGQVEFFSQRAGAQDKLFAGF